jgi:hypothetical protein
VQKKEALDKGRWKARWQKWTADERSFKKRLLLAMPVCVLFVFIYFIYGPVDLTVANLYDLNFMLHEVWWVYALSGVLAATVCIVLIMLFRGRIFDGILCLFLGFSLASYAQGNFLNIDLGFMDGSPVDWAETYWHGLGNLGVWLIICAIVFLVYHRWPRIWEKVIRAVPGFLLAVQVVALVFIVCFAQQEERIDYYYSQNGRFEVSSEENIVVFVLDGTATEVFDTIFEEKPQMRHVLKDFTSFTNAGSTYLKTFPAIPHLLCGEKLEIEESLDQYLMRAWGENRFFDDLHEAGYVTNLQAPFTQTTGIIYADSPEYAERLEEQIDNLVVLKKGDKRIDYLTLTKDMLQLSAYRYMPHITKQFFWSDFLSLENVVDAKDADRFKYGDAEFYEDLCRERLVSNNAEEKKFLYYHLHGLHPFYYLDENAKKTEEETSEVAQALGVATILEEYLNQLKDAGAYDNSTILITADHGDTSYERLSMCFFIKPKGVVQDSLQINEAPITHDQTRATLLDSAGLDYSAYGFSAFSMPPVETERSIYAFESEERSGVGERGRYSARVEYRYTGDIKDFYIFDVAPYDIVYAQ